MFGNIGKGDLKVMKLKMNKIKNKWKNKEIKMMINLKILNDRNNIMIGRISITILI